MNPIIPFAFKTLCIITNPDTIPHVSLELADNAEIGNIIEVEEACLGDINLITDYVEATNGASRRTLASYKDHPVDIIDAGSWGMEGFLDQFYFTDIHGDTLTAWFTVNDATPTLSQAPEGGYTIEFTDRISLIVLNHDTDEQEGFILRDNQVIYKLDQNGIFSLSSIRPKPNDIVSLTEAFRIYDIDTDSENPLSSTELSQKLRVLFPFPGRVKT